MAEVLYGLVAPTPALWSELEAGRVILAGCAYEEGAPEWACTHCRDEE